MGVFGPADGDLRDGPLSPVWKARRVDRTAATVLLERLGVRAEAHPGRTLLDHLLSTFDELDRLGIGDPVRAAALCHAVYGTDGLGNLTLDDRPRLRREIGDEAEHLVYLYAITDQPAFVAESEPDEPALVDRRDGTRLALDHGVFTELLTMWLGNELELLSSAPSDFLLDGGPGVWAMLDRNAALLPADGIAALRDRVGRIGSAL